MRRIISILASAVMVSAVAAPASAQTVPSWARDKQVLVTLVDGPVQTGKLRSISASEVVVERAGRQFHIPLSRVTRVAMPTREVRKRALVGMLVGMVVAPLVLHCGGECAEDLIQIPVLVGFGAGVGAGAGAIVGALQPKNGAQRIVYEPSSPVQSASAPIVETAVQEQPRAPRLQLGGSVGIAAVQTPVNGIAGPAIDGRISWRTGKHVSIGALFGFYGMNDEKPGEGDIVPNGVRIITNRVPNVAQVRTWNGFVQWTSPSGVFIRPGGGLGFHRFAAYRPYPANTPTPQVYLPMEVSEGGLIFSLAAGKEFGRNSRIGFAVEGFFVASSGEDSSSHRTIAGVNVVPLIRW